MELSNRQYPYYSKSAHLSTLEEEMRDFLIYDFNISLKSMLIKYNFLELDNYFFNTCRQTAIFGALILNAFYKDYTYTAYESTFIDTLFGEVVRYQHCYIIASHKLIDRNIMIDVSRTTNPLVFEPIINNKLYPDIAEYKDVVITNTVEIPYVDIYNDNVVEYFTGIGTQEFCKELLLFVARYKLSSSKNKEKVVNEIYAYPFRKMEQYKKEHNLLEKGQTNENRY